MNNQAPPPHPPGIGWRFIPSDEELTRFYLTNKVTSKPVPIPNIKDIEASQFYANHPKDLVDQSVSPWHFFIHHDKYFHGIIEKKQEVGDGIGFWRCAGKEEKVCDDNGKNLASKIHSTFFTATPNTRITDWNMEQFRLPDCDEATPSAQELPREEWVVARLRKGKSSL